MTVEDAGLLICWIWGAALVDWCGSWRCSVCGHNWLDVDAASIAYDCAVAAAARPARSASAGGAT